MDDSVEEVGAHHAGDEPGPNPLNGVGRVRPSGQHWRERGLHGVDLEAGPARLEQLRAAGDVAPGPHPGHEVVKTLREVREDLLGRGPAMDRHVGRIVELHRHPGPCGLGDDLPGPGDGTFHAQLTRGELELSAVGGHELASLNRERFRHHQGQPVAFHGRDQGQGDPGVARRRLHDQAVGAEQAAALRVLDHRQPDPILDAAAWIAPLLLDPDLDPRVEQVVEANLRRPSDDLEDVVDSHAASWWFGWSVG